MSAGFFIKETLPPGTLELQWDYLVTKPQSWKPVGAEMRGKKCLTGGKRVEREVEKNYSGIT